MRANCSDELILKDLEENPPENEFMLRMIEESKPYWVKPIQDLFEFCKDYTLFSYNKRAAVDYAGCLDAWDAGFQQIRAGIWNDELQDEMSKLLMAARDYLRRDIGRFGFVTEEIDDE